MVYYKYNKDKKSNNLMTLTNEMMNTANEILNKYEGKTISNTLANRIKKETNATRVEVDKFFNKAYIIYNGWVDTITDTEDFGEEIGKVTILDIEDNEPEEIYTTERKWELPFTMGVTCASGRKNCTTCEAKS